MSGTLAEFPSWEGPGVGRFMESVQLDLGSTYSVQTAKHEIRRSRNHGEQDESARNRGHAKVSNKGKRSFPMPFVWFACFAVPSTPSFQLSRGSAQII